MDKELLRLVIVLLGMLVMIGMVLWHFIKTLRNRPEVEEFDDADYGEHHSEFDIEDLDDEYAGIPLDLADQPVVAKTADITRLPALIEFSIVARADEGFNGAELFDAFERVGLEYGSVKVFERIDQNRLVDYAVASMVGPGTFPDQNLEQFFCPGIVFFMQPRELDDPAAVFEDFVETIQELAEELDGVAWDNQRQPLTAETIDQFRDLLANQ